LCNRGISRHARLRSWSGRCLTGRGRRVGAANRDDGRGMRRGAFEGSHDGLAGNHRRNGLAGNDRRRKRDRF
jgi:hypothetical protein